MTKKNELEIVQDEVRVIKLTLNSVINWISAAFGVDLTDKGKQFDSEGFSRMEFRTSSNKIILPKPPTAPSIATGNLNAVNLTNSTPLTTVHVFSKDDPNKRLQQSQSSIITYGIRKVDTTSVVHDSHRLPEGYHQIPSGSGTHTNPSTHQGNQEVCESTQSATVNSPSIEQTEAGPSQSEHIKESKKRKKRKASKPKPPKDKGRDDESGSSEEPIQCEICGKFLTSSVAMKRHLQTHRNSRPYSCQECGKSFQRNFHLKTHLMIHSGEKKHQCRFCGKLFLLPKDLVCHERTHTGEKPFECSFCSRKFNLKSHLTMHTRIHTGEKPYKCDMCDKTFSQSNSLRVHKKTHTKVQDGEGDSCTSGSHTPVPVRSSSSSVQSRTSSSLNQKDQTTNNGEKLSPSSQISGSGGNNTAASGAATASLYENIHINLAGHLQSGGAQLVAILEPGQTVNMPMPITFRQPVIPSQAINLPVAVRPNPSSSITTAASLNNMNSSSTLESRVVWLCPDDTSKRIASQNPS